MMQRLRLRSHVSERELMALGSPGAPVSPSVHDHVRQCDRCGRRLAELSLFREELCSTLQASADEAISPGRLMVQRQRIASRLERLWTHAGPATVLRFPSTFQIRTGTHARHRWIAAAALAGLLVGLGAGRVVFWPGVPQAVPGEGVADRSLAGSPSGYQQAAQAEHVADEAFLLEIATALEAPRVLELQAIDAWTPSVREASLSSR